MFKCITAILTLYVTITFPFLGAAPPPSTHLTLLCCFQNVLLSPILPLKWALLFV